MKFSIDKQEKYIIFSLDEENINSVNAPDVKSEFVFLFNEGIANLILDLSKVKFIDSSGLSAILVGNRLWKDIGSFILTGLTHPSVKKLIEISRLDTILNILPTVQESVDFIFLNELEKDLDIEESEDE